MIKRTALQRIEATLLQAIDIARQETADVALRKSEAEAAVLTKAALAKAALDPTQLSGPIDWTLMSVRAATVLRQSGCETAEHVREIGLVLLPQLQRCGKMTATEIIALFNVTDEHETEAAALRQKVMSLQKQIADMDKKIAEERERSKWRQEGFERLECEIRESALTEQRRLIYPAEPPPPHVQEMLLRRKKEQVDEPPAS